MLDVSHVTSFNPSIQFWDMNYHFHFADKKAKVRELNNLYKSTPLVNVVKVQNKIQILTLELQVVCS